MCINGLRHKAKLSSPLHCFSTLLAWTQQAVCHSMAPALKAGTLREAPMGAGPGKGTDRNTAAHQPWPVIHNRGQVRNRCQILVAVPPSSSTIL